MHFFQRCNCAAVAVKMQAVFDTQPMRIEIINKINI